MATTTTHLRGQIVPAARVRPGDRIALDPTFEEVAAVQRARGRKPKVGETVDTPRDGPRLGEGE